MPTASPATAILADVLAAFRAGMAIPAHPLALDERRKLSERHQRALARYYLDAGAGGIAVGVHSTQFQIRDPKIGLYEPVLRLAAETISAHDAKSGKRAMRIAGVCGATDQAVREAGLAASLGYHACLLSLANVPGDDAALVAHCRTVAEVIPVIGFYLQPAVGGRVLSFGFWREFARIPGVIGIKMAPFHRYRTIDVVRGVLESGRSDIALYTGNDDNIVADLVTPFRLAGSDGVVRETRIVGGLLGQWCVWTKAAVELLGRCRELARSGAAVPADLLALNARLTDANAAVFDVAHDFHGCLPGLHYILHGQGLMPGLWCLDPKEVLSPGQAQEIDRVRRAYPELIDDAFVARHRDSWLAA
jgi:dihydrodipicolinate synthase/N-acetylneuraminate lyase